MAAKNRQVSDVGIVIADMIEREVSSHDGLSLRFAVSEVRKEKPWIALIIPFGLKLEVAGHFFEFFEPQYNIVTWESRSILDASDRRAADNEFAIDNHVDDFFRIVSACKAGKLFIIGYCSGAGLALAVANRYPHLVDSLVLVHGEYVMLNESGCTTQFAAEIDSLLSLASRDDEHLYLVYSKIKNDRFEADSGRPDGIDLPFTEAHYLRRYAANYLLYKAVDFQRLAQTVTHNTLVMTGNLDLQSNVASSEKIHALLPNSEILVDPDADHYGILREDSNSLVNIWNYLHERRRSYVR